MLNCLYYFHKYMHDENFVVFHSLITSLIPNHVHVTRFSSNINFTFPNFHKTLYQKQFLVNAIKFWNLLPQDLKQCMSPKLFKIRLKIFLRQQ